MSTLDICQKRADERLPILLDIPAKHKAFMIAPILSEVHVESYLATKQFEQVLCDGEKKKKSILLK